MVGSRWLQRFGPPSVALGVVAVLVTAAGRTAAGPLPAPGCDSAGAVITEASRAVAPAAGDVAGETWYTLDPQLDPDGRLVGQRLRFGRRDGRTQERLLPPESFVTGPFGPAILVGTDDGTTSTVRAVLASPGCDPVVAATNDVIRTATLDPVSGSVYEFRVDRRSRADLGVWRRDRDAAVVRVLEPLPADERFGPTFSTTLSWAEEGEALLVQSCGMTRCRTRVVDVASGAVQAVADGDQGELIGVAAGRLIAYAACRGLPCDISSTDIATGRKKTLVEGSGLARLVSTDTGAVVLHEASADPSAGLVGTDVVTGMERLVSRPQPGLRLVPDGARARGGTRLPPGWALVTADARPAADQPAILIRLSDGATIALPEVKP